MDTKTKDNKIFKKLLIGFIILGVLGAIIAIIIVFTKKKSKALYTCPNGTSVGKGQLGKPGQGVKDNGWYKNEKTGTRKCDAPSCYGTRENSQFCGLPFAVCPNDYQPGKEQTAGPNGTHNGTGWHKNTAHGGSEYICPQTSCYNGNNMDKTCMLPSSTPYPQ